MCLLLQKLPLTTTKSSPLHPGWPEHRPLWCSRHVQPISKAEKQYQYVPYSKPSEVTPARPDTVDGEVLHGKQEEMSKGIK